MSGKRARIKRYVRAGGSRNRYQIKGAIKYMKKRRK